MLYDGDPPPPVRDFSFLQAFFCNWLKIYKFLMQ